MGLTSPTLMLCTNFSSFPYVVYLFLIYLNTGADVGLKFLSEIRSRSDPDPIRKSGYLEGPNLDLDSKMLDPSKPDSNILIF